MKHVGIRFSGLSYIAAFAVGVILFASFWKMWFGSASSVVVLAGMAGTAVAVVLFWLRSEYKNAKDREN
jgi:glucan phosphoethanolaminetransferase (alkaline phosphatase superfamily)